MSDDLSITLLPALEIAAFDRAPDGSFSSISPTPPWFGRLVSGGTFPFLGHILEEANDFWTAGTPGFQEFGPCAEVDDAGREYHYKVIAVSASGRQFLLFQRDPGTDRMREVLQTAREQALRGQDDARTKAIVELLQKEAAATASEIRGLAAKLKEGQISAEEIAILEAIMARCDRLRSCVANVRLVTARPE